MHRYVIRTWLDAELYNELQLIQHIMIQCPYYDTLRQEIRYENYKCAPNVKFSMWYLQLTARIF